MTVSVSRVSSVILSAPKVFPFGTGRVETHDKRSEDGVSAPGMTLVSWTSAKVDQNKSVCGLGFLFYTSPLFL